MNRGAALTAALAVSIVASLLVAGRADPPIMAAAATTTTPREDQPGQPIELGLSPLLLREPATTAAGNRPLFRWDAVDGAAAYLLAVLTIDNEPVWAWHGTSTEVIIGGWDAMPSAEAPGPLISEPSQWFVVAVDTAGVPIANSVLRPVSP